MQICRKTEMAPSPAKKRKHEEVKEEGCKGTNKKPRKNEKVNVKTGRGLKGKGHNLPSNKTIQKMMLDKKGNRRKGGMTKEGGGNSSEPRLRRMASLNAQAKMHALYDSDGKNGLEDPASVLAPESTATVDKKVKKQPKNKKSKGKNDSKAVPTCRRMASLNAQAILSASLSTDRPKLSLKVNSPPPPPQQQQAKPLKRPMILEESEEKAKRRTSLSNASQNVISGVESKKEREILMEKIRPQQIKTVARRLEEQMDVEKTLAKMVISGDSEILLRDKVKAENIRSNKIEDKAEVTITGMYINPVTNTSQSFCFSRVQTYKQATSTTFNSRPPTTSPRPPPAHLPTPQQQPPPPPTAHCHFTHYPPNITPSNLAVTAGPTVPLDLALGRPGPYPSAFTVTHYAPSHATNHYARHPAGFYQPTDSCLIHKPVPFHPFQNNQSQRISQPALANTPGSSTRPSFTTHALAYQSKSITLEQQRPLQTSSLPTVVPPTEVRRVGNGSKQGLYFGHRRVSGTESNANVGCQHCIHLSSSSSSSHPPCPSHWKPTRPMRGRPPSSMIGYGRPQPTKPDVGGRLSTLPTQTKTDLRTVAVYPSKKVKMEVDDLVLDLDNVPTLNKRYNNDSPPVGNHPMATRRLKGSPEEGSKIVKQSLNSRTKVTGTSQIKRVAKDGHVAISAEEFFKKVTSTNWLSSTNRHKEMESLRRQFNPTVAVSCLPLASQLKKLISNESRAVSIKSKTENFKEIIKDCVNGAKKVDHQIILHSSKHPLPLTQPRTSSVAASQSSRKPITVNGQNSNSSKVVISDIVQPISRNRAIKNVTRYSNGWTWEGAAFQKDIYIKNDDFPVRRRCFPAMRHIEGDIIRVRDCVLLKSGPRKNDLPYVAKVAALWENPEDGEMMFSLLWYYRPEHTEFGRKPHHMEDEIFASKHRDVNSVACIEDKCYVLTMNEYCRYRRRGRMMEQCIQPNSSVVATLSEGYARANRQPPGRVSADMVFFCRKVYDFRQKRILKNPT